MNQTRHKAVGSLARYETADRHEYKISSYVMLQQMVVSGMKERPSLYRISGDLSKSHPPRHDSITSLTAL